MDDRLMDELYLAQSTVALLNEAHREQLNGNKVRFITIIDTIIDTAPAPFHKIVSELCTIRRNYERSLSWIERLSLWKLRRSRSVTG